MFCLNIMFGTPTVAESNEKHIDDRKDMYAFQTLTGAGTHLFFRKSMRF